MFKRLTIELAGPVCSCKVEDLGWGIGHDMKGRANLLIVCNRCDTKLTVGHEAFIARFTLDKAYPEGVTKQKPDAKILKLHKTDDA